MNDFFLMVLSNLAFPRGEDGHKAWKSRPNTIRQTTALATETPKALSVNSHFFNELLTMMAPVAP
jgi:hypothetical protein